MKDNDRPTEDFGPTDDEADSALRPTAGFGGEGLPGPASEPGQEPSGRTGGGLISGKYRILELLGAGGMGRVYRVRHEGLGKDFALKLLKTGDEDRESLRRRFESEAKALGQLDHPGILAVIDYGIDEAHGGSPYLVTEILRGHSLGDVLRKGGALPLHEALPLLRAVAAALDYAHGRGILHRDIKPDNVFLCEDGTVKLLDFGLAKLDPHFASLSSAETNPAEPEEHPGVEGDVTPDAPTAEWSPDASAPPAASAPGRSSLDIGLTKAGSVVGTPGYVPPEVLRGAEASRASDLYSLGVLLHRTLSAKLPRYPAGGLLAQGDPLPLSKAAPSLPRELDAPLAKALSLRPEARPPTAWTFADEVERSAAKAGRRQWAARAFPRRALAALSLVGGFGMVAWLGAGARPLSWLECKLYDVRVALCSARAPDPRIQLLLMGDPSAGDERKRILDRGPEIGKTAADLIHGGAAAVVLDVIAPQEFREVRPFQEAVARYGGDRLFLAVASAGPGDLSGGDCLAPLTEAVLLASPVRWKRLFVYATVLQDPDGRIRRVRTAFRDSRGELHPTVGAAAAAPLGPIPPLSETGLWMDGRLAASSVVQLSWREREALVQSGRAELADKVFIIGATSRFAGEDKAVLPQPGNLRATIPGAALQALMASTLLERRNEAGEVGGALPLLFLLGVGAVSFFLLTSARMGPPIAAGTALLLVYGLAGWAVMDQSGRVLALGWPVAAGLTAGVCALALRRLWGPIPSGRPSLAPTGKLGSNRGGMS